MSWPAPFFFLFGASVGSFLNVLALRWLAGKAITGRSLCPHCQQSLPWFSLVPLLSFMFLHGRCTHCTCPISVQYPLIEFIAGLCALILFIPLPSTYSAWLAQLLIFIMIALLLVLAIIDSRSFLLPDTHIIILSLIVLLYLWLISPGVWFEPLLGSLLGSGFLFLIWLATRGRGLGFGDVKLMLPLGALFGFPAVFILLWLAFIAGGLVGLWLLWRGRANLKTALPFGPYLVLAALILLLAPQLVDQVFLWV
jgi:prepilin signal peptidase PulO-like enzyme (type II secretory pathway)